VRRFIDKVKLSNYNWHGSNQLAQLLEMVLVHHLRKVQSNTRDVDGVGGVEFYTYISPVTTGSSNI
jgi:hypothetical protein